MQSSNFDSAKLRIPLFYDGEHQKTLGIHENIYRAGVRTWEPYMLEMVRTPTAQAVWGKKLLFCRGASSRPARERERCCSTLPFPKTATVLTKSLLFDDAVVHICG